MLDVSDLATFLGASGRLKPGGGVGGLLMMLIWMLASFSGGRLSKKVVPPECPNAADCQNNNDNAAVNTARHALKGVRSKDMRVLPFCPGLNLAESLKKGYHTRRDILLSDGQLRWFIAALEYYKI
jgi:hypothetical protein